MILELDCGNSLIKWRVLQVSGDVAAQGASVSAVDLLSALSDLTGVKIERARLVSVRSDLETEELCSCISSALFIDVQRALPAPRLGGVVNGYLEYDRLGMDRWLAMVGAFQLERRAMVVIDLGTAVTVDFVDAEGGHLGGYICPGISLLRQQLTTHTRRISFTAEEIPVMQGEPAPGRSTVQAVERGCFLMLRSFVASQVLAASDYLGADFVIYSTGGDATLIDDMVGVRRVPDLVFRGLAIACP